MLACSANRNVFQEISQNFRIDQYIIRQLSCFILGCMVQSKTPRPLYQRIAIDIAGFGMVIAAPLTGWLPGPGGIPLFVAGLGLLSLNHEWAERFLHYFEEKRVEFTDKYLMASSRVSRTIDILCAVLMVVGLVIAITQESFLIRGLGLGTFSLSLITVLSNQKRFERIVKKLKKH
jgi:hypothetical protein